MYRVYSNTIEKKMVDVGCDEIRGTVNSANIPQAVRNRAARLIAIIAPVVVTVACFNVFLVWKDKDIICAVMWVLMLLPAVPASYLNLKHILLPADDFGFLGATRFCNISALALYIIMSAFAACSASDSSRLVGIFSCLMSLAVFGFAVLENAFILGGSAASVSIVDAIMRGLGAGIMHGLCTLAVGYGMSFVHYQTQAVPHRNGRHACRRNRLPRNL